MHPALIVYFVAAGVAVAYMYLTHATVESVVDSIVESVNRADMKSVNDENKAMFAVLEHGDVVRPSRDSLRRDVARFKEIADLLMRQFNERAVIEEELSAALARVLAVGTPELPRARNTTKARTLTDAIRKSYYQETVLLRNLSLRYQVLALQVRKHC